MPLTDVLVADYHRDGYVILHDLLTPREADVLRAAINIDDPGSQFGDGGGRTSRLSFWSNTADTIWGAASTCPRIINNVRVLLGEEAAFFHGKVTLKEARTGGAWEWHQDFGYWYEQGYVMPRMISVSVALDHNDLSNGCLQVYRGSHKMGRLTHGMVAKQLGADAARLKAIEKYFERVPVVLPPGAALFFHCNTLHASGANDSDRHRRNFIVCYNALGNPQVGEHKSSQPFPCPVGPEDVIERYAKKAV